MKPTLIAICLMTLAAPALAADPYVAIQCSGEHAEIGKLTLTARSAKIFQQNEGTMWTVVASVESHGGTRTGRAKTLDATANYKPTKYKNHSKFDLSKLTDIEDFGSFSPVDDCTLNVLVPNDFASKKIAYFPVVASCDQNGGSFKLTCSVTPEN